MSSHITFTHKYRPKQLSEVSYQDILTKVINNAVVLKKVNHAYLFSGTRGVGKTSTARIIANLINCAHTQIKDDNVYSCYKCKNCDAYISGSHPDIIEIDAASNTGVDNIRTIIEDANYKPVLGSYKVYIIDEAHMLSKSAFNAFLKVLEEPPQNIVFILATTEPNKIPITIVSRCQNFALQRVSVANLSSYIADVCKKEKIQCSETAIEKIAVSSEGSIRDALSILEKAALLSVSSISQNNTNVIIDEVCINNIVRTDKHYKYLELANCILQCKTKQAITLVHHLYNSNTNISYIVESLIKIISDICKDRSCSNSDQELKPVIQSAQVYDMPTLMVTWKILLNSIPELDIAPCKLMHLEMIIIEVICALEIGKSDCSLISSSDEIKKTEEDTISPKVINILSFLQKERHFELYYYLMNEVEITKCTDVELQLISNINANNNTKKIKEVLETSYDKNFVVHYTKVNDDIVTLKNKLINILHHSEEWQLINKYYPEAKVQDILYNNKLKQ